MLYLLVERQNSECNNLIQHLLFYFLALNIRPENSVSMAFIGWMTFLGFCSSSISDKYVCSYSTISSSSFNLNIQHAFVIFRNCFPLILLIIRNRSLLYRPFPRNDIVPRIGHGFLKVLSCDGSNFFHLTLCGLSNVGLPILCCLIILTALFILCSK